MGIDSHLENCEGTNVTGIKANVSEFRLAGEDNGLESAKLRVETDRQSLRFCVSNARPTVKTGL